YARYGTKELSLAAIRALEGRNGCLLANHGMIATGSSLEKAMWLAVELETIAKQYYMSLLIGGPVLLSEAQIAETREAFAGYGLQDAKGTSGRQSAAAQPPAAGNRRRTKARVGAPRA
ncbi:MAG: class II aldolase/adducin family protein, partial [Methylobacteriaceae bacterium]|nr:class II aldolase/adducin family protein [Methylobacteriaceae bacterium]